tara:strand:- start:306 stop:737 length:432 start_codon:yes stop_codon:yes gene_type:complete
MIYDKATIKTIHKKKLAVVNNIYTDYDGNTYIGTIEGYLKLQNNTAVKKEIVELKKEIKSATQPVPTPPVVPVVEEGSYFGLDSNGDLSPLSEINKLLSTNIFELDLETGDLTTRNSTKILLTDEFFTTDGISKIYDSNTITG